MTDAEKIADEFIERICAILTGKEWQELRKRNAAQTDKGICHSHDFCDANIPMAEAFEWVLCREIDCTSDADATIWNAAWGIAKAREFILS